MQSALPYYSRVGVQSNSGERTNRRAQSKFHMARLIRILVQQEVRVWSR